MSVEFYKMNQALKKMIHEILVNNVDKRKGLLSKVVQEIEKVLKEKMREE